MKPYGSCCNNAKVWVRPYGTHFTIKPPNKSNNGKSNPFPIYAQIKQKVEIRGGNVRHEMQNLWHQDGIKHN